MNVTINVDETKFKDVLEKELNAFDKNELHEIIKEAIKTFLHNEDTKTIIEKLFIKKDENTFGINRFVPTDYLTRCVQQIDFSEDVKELKTAIIKELTENSKEIVTDLFAKSITKTLVDSLMQSCEFEDIIRMNLRGILNNR